MSSVFKSTTYCTLIVKNNEILIDCAYADEHYDQMINRTGVCNLNIALDKDYVEKVSAVTSKIQTAFNESVQVFFTHFFEKPTWLLLIKQFDYDGLRYYLQYDSLSSFDNVENKNIIQYQDKSCYFDSTSVFVVFDAPNFIHPARIGFWEKIRRITHH